MTIMTVTVKKANIFQAASTLYNDMKRVVADRLSEFCVNKIIEFGLATKTFEFYFSFFGANTLEVATRRKSMAKLKALLVKHIAKLAPQIAFTTTPLLDIHNRDDLVFTSMSESFVFDLENIPSSRWEDYFDGGTPNVKSFMATGS